MRRASRPSLRVQRAQAGAVAVVALLLLVGCTGGPNEAAWQLVPMTLAWDQPDGLAEYFHVRTGIQMLRTEAPTVTLHLPPDTHIVRIEACNQAGCSSPAIVTVAWSEGRWLQLASEPGRMERLHAPGIEDEGTGSDVREW